MPVAVRLSEAARSDLIGIGNYIAQHDSPGRARRVVDEIEQRIEGLSELPSRGPHVREMLAMGINDFRELHSGPFRIIYEYADGIVSVLVVADGRRDMRTLLVERLLED